ncbi:hypothetical protein BC835DRAFT_1422625 [Cytidiella melzeri]|nr:hypothetical protein BC835DRAFT_1422625 [Cytidiella melzeri]
MESDASVIEILSSDGGATSVGKPARKKRHAQYTRHTLKVSSSQAISDLQKRITELEEEKKIRDNVAKLNTRVQALEDEKKQAQETITELNSRIQGLSYKEQLLKDTVRTLETRVKDLESMAEGYEEARTIFQDLPQHHL